MMNSESSAQDMDRNEDSRPDIARVNGTSVHFEQSRGQSPGSPNVSAGHSGASQRPEALQLIDEEADHDESDQEDSDDDETSASSYGEKLRLEVAMKRLRAFLLGGDGEEDSEDDQHHDMDDADLLFLAVDFIKKEMDEHAVVARLLQRLRIRLSRQDGNDHV